MGHFDPHEGSSLELFLHKDTPMKLEATHPGDNRHSAEFEVNYTVTDESAITLIISVKVCNCMHN